MAGKGGVLKNLAIDRILYDCMVICTFPRMVVGIENLAKAYSAITGRSCTEDEIKEIGFRIMTLERMFNVREGIRRKDDCLPARLLKEPLPDGPRKGSVVPLDDLLDEAYQALGWDTATGVPLKETLEALGLAELCL